jgi:RNA polymerase sigma factor (sigma-70 family)
MIAGGGTMAHETITCERFLEAPWPPFLDLLDSDPPRAQELIARTVYAYLETHALRLLRPLGDRRHDAIQVVVLHLLNGDFRVLRKYKNEGRPFGTWFSRVVGNRLRDFVRHEPPDCVPIDGAVGREGSSPAVTLIAPNPGPDKMAEDRILLEQVATCFNALEAECRYVLMSRAEGRSGMEIAKILWPPWPEDTDERMRLAKAALEKGRSCRKALLRCLVKRGIRLEEALAG